MFKNLFKSKEQKITHQWFQYLFALFIVLIPWQVRWIFYDLRLDGQIWEYGRLSLYASFIVLIIAAVLFAYSHKKELHFSKNKLLYLVFIYSIIIPFFSSAPLVSFYWLALVYAAVLFAYLARFLQKKFVLNAILLSGLIQGLVALQQFFNQQIFANKWLGLAEHLPETLGTSVVLVDGERILRAYGALPHPNILGGFLFVAIFVGIYLLLKFYKELEDSKWSKKFIRQNLFRFLFISVSLIITTYGLLASFSRSALLGLAVAMVSVLLINIFQNKWSVVKVILKYFVVLLVIFYSFNWIIPGAWQARWTISNRLEAQSIDQRVDTFEQLKLDGPKEILFGQGLGMNTYDTWQQNPNQTIYNIQPIHDIFLLALAEIGLIGIIILIALLRLVLRAADKVDVLSTSLLLGLIVIGIFDHYLWTSWTGWLLVTFGLVNLYKQRK
jgi:O-antigen ligase